MILTRKIKTMIVPSNIEIYRKLGYDVELKKKITINVKDLPLNSRVIVNVKCDSCGTTKKIRYCDYIKVFNKKNKYYCFICKGESIKSGVNSKYGVDNVFQLDEVKEKIKETNIKLYGVEYPIQNRKIFEKTKKTNILKYGVEYPNQNSEVLSKQQQTNIEKYNTKYSFLNDDVKEKIKFTNIKKYGVDHPFKNDKIKNKIKVSKSLNILNKYKNYKINKIENESYYIYCDKCDDEFVIDSQNFRNRNKYGTIMCTKCNPLNSYGNSGLEIQLQDFIKQYYKIIQNSKKIISPYELDIYIPELKLAFEFNGVWWHNELYKYKGYHIDKTETCEEQEIQLIQIWEDDWIYKQDIVKSMILNKLGKIENKIYARKTEVTEVFDNKLVRKFLDKNHIQGFVGSNIKLGLFYDDELVSLMTFGKRRVAMGKKKTNEGEYELLRFCNKLNTNIVGGASKLFKYFINNYKPKEITTYADRSYSNGNLYKQLGFDYVSKTDPNYYYIIDGFRHHRFNFRKDVLVKEGYDANKTEHQIMLERNIYRIYDSGNLKFRYVSL